MKKLISILLVAFAIGFTSCNKEKNTVLSSEKTLVVAECAVGYDESYPTLYVYDVIVDPSVSDVVIHAHVIIITRK